MLNELKTSFVSNVIFLLILGVGYTAGVTLLAEFIAPSKSHGSIIRVADRNIGSELLGQGTPNDKYFYNRPSAGNYQTIPSRASNLGPLSRRLRDNIKKLRDSISRRDGIDPQLIAPDLLTTSGSGVDPHISPNAALQQVKRIAALRLIPEQTVVKLIKNQTEYPLFGFVGQKRVNVLNLNLALDNLESDP